MEKIFIVVVCGATASGKTRLAIDLAKRFDGEIIMWYMVLYGIGRFWIEGLRTDQLFLWNTGIPVSQLVSVVMVLIGGSVIGYQYWKLGKKKKEAAIAK